MQAASTSGEWIPDPELVEVNSCLAGYDVELYRGPDGRYRIWGDINRIQDIMFGPCVELLPPAARQDLDHFFASEVDVRIAEALRAAGVDARVDLADGIGIAIHGDAPSAELVDRCFLEVYSTYSKPPTPQVRPPGAP